MQTHRYLLFFTIPASFHQLYNWWELNPSKNGCTLADALSCSPEEQFVEKGWTNVPFLDATADKGCARPVFVGTLGACFSAPDFHASDVCGTKWFGPIFIDPAFTTEHVSPVAKGAAVVYCQNDPPRCASRDL